MSRIPSTINVYDNYDSGQLTNVGIAGQTVSPENKLAQLLIYPREDCKLTINGSDKWIFLPKEMWSPISILCDTFNVATIAGTGDVFWQGWY